MIKFCPKAFASYRPRKWQKLKLSHRGHPNFKEFSYKVGPCVYHSRCQEIMKHFEHFRTWEHLNQ